MFKTAFILITGMGGFCNLLSGAICGICSQYIEGSYHLISGYILAKICLELIKDENRK